MHASADYRSDRYSTNDRRLRPGLLRSLSSRVIFSLAAIQLMPLGGCSILTDSQPASLSEDGTATQVKLASEANNGQAKIANPPARTIRFDGHEIVLGDVDGSELTPDKFMSVLEPMVQEERLRSAAVFVRQMRETAERILSERWATDPKNPCIHLIAKTLSQRSTNRQADWESLLSIAIERPEAPRAYQQIRNAFANKLQHGDPSNEEAGQLQQLAQRVAHPLVKIDSLRLLGLRELVNGRNAWAESLCRQASELAMSSGNQLLAAELSLLVAESARRSDQPGQALVAWKHAVATHLSAMHATETIDVAFWLLAERIRPEGTAWPNETISAFGTHLQTTGCTSDGGAEMVLWACVAAAQFERGASQSALVLNKRAEQLAKGNNVMWLRIAQARCLAALGQVPAASALLSGPAASSEPSLSAAATAAMGSTKLQAGAYQQGAQLLNKALSQAKGAQWPGKTQALADLALAQLIIGDTQPGLDALHAVQAQFVQTGDQMMLIRSLENEMRLLEHESRHRDASAVKTRIAELERLP